MREIYIKSKAGLLPIGRRGENLATRVHLSEVPADGQAVTVFVLRNGDTAAYPASEVEVTDTEIVWTVTSVDTGKSGRGKVQYKFADSVTGEVIKTEIYGFIVGLAIDTEVGPAPDPYESWLDSLTDLAGQAQVAAREAETNATQASESAEQAEASAQNAEQSASSAGTHATNAQNSATTASQKAAQAAASEANAQTYATQAQASAESAGASATSAEESAESASASAESASESQTAAESASQSAHEWGLFSQTYASQAAASATAAGQSATAASASATSASQSATTATTKASEASASATTATAKAAEASASATAAQAAQAGAETAQAGAESAAQTAQAGADAVGLLREQIYNSYPNVTAETAPIVSIPDGADGIPVKSLVVGIDPVQAGSGDPSPTNVRPITGWTGANVQRTGINVWDEEWEIGGIDSSTGENTATASIIRTKNYIPILPDTAYFIQAGNYPDANIKTRFYDESKNYIGYVQKSGTAVTPNTQFTTPTNARYLRFQFPNSYGTTYNHDISINYPSIDTVYHSGTDNATYPITFPYEAGTVYGGSLDVTTGVLTVDRACEQMTYSYLSGLNANYIGFQSNVPQVGGNSVWVRNWNYAKAAARTSGGIKAACNAFPVSMHNTSIFAAQYRIYFGVGSMTTVDEFKTAVENLESSGEGLWIAYELAEPQTYQLTPTEVTTLLGSNSIWADTGDVQEMAYRADTKLYIDEVFEDYQDDLTDYASALAALGLGGS